MAQAKEITIGVFDLEFSEAVRHAFETAGDDAAGGELREELAERGGFEPQINIPVIRSGIGSGGRSSAANHDLGRALAKHRECVGRGRGKRIADEAKDITIPLDGARHVRHPQKRYGLYDRHMDANGYGIAARRGLGVKLRIPTRRDARYQTRITSRTVRSEACSAERRNNERWRAFR